MSVRAPVIGLEDVTKRFGATTAVDAVSLSLVEGEFFALLGPSGCGKTTLLRIVAGFEAPDAGRVLLDDADITHLRAARRPVNLMFQSYALFPHMSVYRNIAYGLEMERLPRAEIARRVEEVMAMASLAGLADRRPDELSGGQRQRVALARALVKRPRVLLLDEPLAALDKKLKEQMQLELKRMQHEVGITFVVVTHDQEEALVMADRIALMKDGRIEQLGSPRALYEAPESRFVADFIGVTNLFEGALAEGGVALAVRPERISLSRSQPDGYTSLRGTVAEIAYHGQSLSVHVAVEGLAKPVLCRVPAADEAADTIEAGQQVWCLWDPKHGRVLTR